MPAIEVPVCADTTIGPMTTDSTKTHGNSNSLHISSSFPDRPSVQRRVHRQPAGTIRPRIRHHLCGKLRSVAVGRASGGQCDNGTRLTTEAGVAHANTGRDGRPLTTLPG